MAVPVAMVSSTVLDLPQHREKVRDACLKAEYFPRLMESLAARHQHPVTTSLQMVDGADVLVGVYGWRYGYVPDGHVVSITEMELNRAEERHLPVFAFVADPKHEGVADHVETVGEAQTRLSALKARVSKDHTIRKFASAESLEYEVFRALMWHRIEDAATARQTIVFAKLAEADDDEAQAQRISFLASVRDVVKRFLRTALPAVPDDDASKASPS